MSFKVTNWVWARSESRNGARLVMLALADRADDNGCAWPSIDDLVERTKLSPRAVQKAVTALVESGELEVENGGGRHRSNRYRIIPKPRTNDGVTDEEPRTSDGVSAEETPHFEPETPHFEAETPHSATQNPVQSAPEPYVEPPENRQGNNPPTPRPESGSPTVTQTAEKPIADRMTDAFMERYRHGNSYRPRTVRQTVADALGNGTDPTELWRALEQLGENSSPVSANSLQFAFSKIRRQQQVGTVIDIASGQPLTGTDATVAGWAAVAAQLAEQQGDSA